MKTVLTLLALRNGNRKLVSMCHGKYSVTISIFLKPMYCGKIKSKKLILPNIKYTRFDKNP